MLERVWRKGNLPTQLVGMEAGTASMENSMEVPKLRTELPYDPAIPLLGLFLENNMIWMDTCTPVLTAALFTTLKTWKQTKCPLTEEWIKKMWYMYIMEYYSAIKKNEIMPFVATQMGLEIVILSEVG